MTLALTFANARWRLWRLLQRRWFGPSLLVLALGLLGGAAAWHLRTEALWQARLADLQATAAAPAPPAPTAADERRQALRAFYTALPAQDEIPAALQKLIDLGQAQRLQLLQGSYRLDAEPAAGFARYRMNLPLRGEPPQVQQFVSAAMRAFPTLAVDSIQFKRETDDTRLLDARVQWVLYVRTGAPGKAQRP